MKKNLLLILSFLAVSIISAQQSEEYPSSLTLEQFRGKVLEYSQELKQARESVYGAEYSQKAVFTGYLPAISLSADASYDITDIGSSAGDGLKPFNYNVGANLSQYLYAGGALRANNMMAENNITMNQLSEQLTKEEILYHADLIYWQTAMYAQMLENAQTYYEIVDELFNVTNIRFDDGLVSKSDLLMVHTRLKEAELLLNQAQRVSTISYQHFNIMMGLPIDLRIKISDDINIIETMPQFMSVEEALAQRVEFQILETNIALQQLNIKAIKSKYNPVLLAGVDAGYGNISGQSSFGATAYATLRYPIFQWGAKKHEVRSANIESNKLNIERTILKDQVNNELTTAWISLNDNFKSIDIAKDNLAIATENMELNTLRYNDGLSNNIDVLSAQLSWIQASNNTTEALYNFKVSIADYKKSIGKIE